MTEVFLITFRRAAVFLLFGALPSFPLAQWNEKPAPRGQEIAPRVTVQSQTILKMCDPEIICVQGLIKNEGRSPATRVYLKIPIGATQHIPPRKILYGTVTAPRMEPGDQQEFYVEIPRSVRIRSKGRWKKMAVGKYNFDVVPMWDGKLKR